MNALFQFFRVCSVVVFILLLLPRAAFALTYINTYNSAGQLTSSTHTTVSYYAGTNAAGNAVFVDAGGTGGNDNFYVREVTTVSSGGSSHSGGGTVTPVPVVPTDSAPLGDLVETLGSAYKGPNTSCEAIEGWSCDRDFRDRPVTIHLYVDDVFYTAFDTSIPRPGMIAPWWAPQYGSACGPSTNAMWGFRYVTPTSLKDGLRHSIKVYSINQGPRGSALNTLLPNEGWSKGFAFNMQCSAPLLPVNLGAVINGLPTQTEGVPFTITAKAINIGRVPSKLPFTLRVQVDKKSDATADGWGYEGPGINGDIRVQTSIPPGLTADATTSHDFTGVLLPIGSYRMRAQADPDYLIEASTSRQLANNTTNWTYFTVKAEVPAPDLSFASFAISEKCAVGDMTISDQCRTTKVTFTVRNTGTKAIASGTNIPYSVEYLLPGEDAAGTWHKTTSVNYTGGIAIGATTTAIVATVPNLPVGTISLRAVINPLPRSAAVGETNFSNNVSNARALTYVAANADLSFQSFAITDTCDPKSMAGGVACPNTKASLVLLNTGNKIINSGIAVPYSIESQGPGGVWRTLMTGTFTGGIAAKSGTVYGVSSRIVATIPGLKMGETTLRAIVNPAPRATALNEVNFSDNTSETITQTYAFEVGKVTLNWSNQVVRYGAVTDLTWQIAADYTLRCAFGGPLKVGETANVPNTPGVIKNGTTTTAALKNTQLYSLTCTPVGGPGIPPDIITRAVTVEVIPLVQEI